MSGKRQGVPPLCSSDTLFSPPLILSIAASLGLAYSTPVPELCRFLGIVIAMFYREHGPAHFHAVYGEFDITVEIETGIVNGKFPKRALMHVIEWHGLHQAELMENWRLVQERKPLKKIQPLE